MRWLLAVAVLLALGKPSIAAERVVQFTSSPFAPAFRAAPEAIRGSDTTVNVRVADVSAAFVALVDGKTALLLVHLGGEWCGSAGCAISLYEQGVKGWIRDNEWQSSTISVMPSKDALGWHNLLLDYEVVWTRFFNAYLPARKP